MESASLIFPYPEDVEHQEIPVDHESIRKIDIKPYDRVIQAFIYSFPPAERLDLPAYKGTWQTVQLWASIKSDPSKIICKAAATTDTRNGLELKTASCSLVVKANWILEIVYAYKPGGEGIPHLETWEIPL